MNTIIQKEIGVYCLDSSIPGPVISILWGIHGDESCWVELLDFARENIEIMKWKIYFIYGNLEAISKNTRQCDVNLNRIFKDESLLTECEKSSSEYRHMMRIKKYLALSDACLDIHSSPTSGSPAFVICEPDGFDIVNNFPVDFICSWFTNVEPWGTDDYMYQSNKIWICVECGCHTSNQAFEIAQKSLFCFLEYFWMQQYPLLIQVKDIQYLQATRAYLTQTKSYVSAKLFKDFENITQKTLLWYDGNIPVYASQDGHILFARDRDVIWVEAFVELIVL